MTKFMEEYPFLVVSGRREVRKEILLGPQTACWAYTLLNMTSSIRDVGIHFYLNRKYCQRMVVGHVIDSNSRGTMV